MGRFNNKNWKCRWKGDQRRIGITGGIASGKSTIGRYLEDVKYIPILDTDQYTRDILNYDDEIKKSIINRYGKEILNKTNILDAHIERKSLAKIIFNNSSERLWLESIIHPLIYEKIEFEFKKQAKKNIIGIMVPLLFEKNLCNLFSEIWVIDCTLEQQYQRLMKRDSLNQEDAKKRIDSQLPTEYKKKFADHIINNSGKDYDWQAQINDLIL